MKYNPKIVLAYFRGLGLPEPELEFKFHPTRKWRFDFAWPTICRELEPEIIPGTAMEVEGGLWIGGGHSRGSGRVKDIEKYSEAAALGWRIIYVQPKDLCTADTTNLIKRCLGII